MDVVEEQEAPGPATGASEPTEPAPTGTSPRRDRRAWYLAGVVVLPLVVSAIALLVRRPDFIPISDYALTELQVRNVGHHEVLTGLYSRSDWSHPGPLFFYLLAPFYWLSGGASLSMFFTSLLVNGLAVAGIAWIGWRRGGTSMLLCALLGCALVMRTMGPEFLFDPWNNYVVTLLFGLMLFATWASLCGDRWALWVAVVTGSFLAQTHVGFLLLALPLVAVGGIGFALPVLRKGVGADRRRAVFGSLAIAAGLGVLLWLPVLFDLATNRPSNPQRIAHYFQDSDDVAQSLRTGWRIVAGQFSWPSEWLVQKRTDVVGYGESPFKTDSALPWLLVPVAIATAWQWARRRDDQAGARYLGAVLWLAIGIGVVAVARTLGPALDYRLRWTWMLGLAGFVLVLFTVWQVAEHRVPRLHRYFVIVVGALLVLVSAGNVVSAARVDGPWRGESAAMAAVTPTVVDRFDPDGGQVVFSDRDDDASWYTRGFVLQLERAGIDARVPRSRVALFGEARVVQDDEPVQATLLVVADDSVRAGLENPSLRLVARWRPDPRSDYAANFRRRAELDRRLERGDLTVAEHVGLVQETTMGPPDVPLAKDLAVFEILRSPPP